MIDWTEVFAVIRDKKTIVERPMVSGLNFKDICPLMSNYGKLLEALAFSIINFVCKNFSGPNSRPKQLIESAMIERFYSKLINEKDHYYSEIVERLQSA